MGRFGLLLCLMIGCASVSVQASPFKCRTQGRFPHPNDCGSYFECFIGPDGEMQTREKRCFGFPYSPDQKRCVSFEEKPDCTPVASKSTRLSGLPIASLKYLCEGLVLEGCVHCYLGYTCIGGEAYVTLCENKETGSGDSCADTSPFAGSCLPYNTGAYTPADCACESVNIYADFFNTSFYHYCDPNQKTRNTYQCGEGETYDTATSTCKADGPTTTPATPACNGFGINVNPNDCRFYYSCLPDGSVSAGFCAEGEYFNTTDNTCEQSCKFLSSSTPAPNDCTGKADGGYRDASDCTKYYLCLSENILSTSQCPSGTYYDPAENGKCSSTVPAECQSPGFDYSQCPGAGDVTPC